MASGKIKSPIQALKMAASIHNNAPNKQLNGIAPNQVQRTDVGKIVEFQLQRKRNAAEKIPDMSKKFKIGDHVRIRLPKTPFTKSNEPRWSDVVYKIIDINASWPTPSYKLQAIQSGTSLPGTFSYDQLQKIPSEK